MAMSGRPTPTEDVEQAHLFQWAAWAECEYPELRWMHHIPNGGKRSKAEAARFKGMGVKAGVPDIFLPVRMMRYDFGQGLSYAGLYIELKRETNGRVSREQDVWITGLREQGYACEVCHGWQEARAVIERYLRGTYVPVYMPSSRRPKKEQKE